jgi:hypothetical protein
VVRIERKHDVAYDGSYIDSPRAPATGGSLAATGTYGTGGLVNQGDPVNDLLFPHSFNRLASGTFTVDSGGHTYSLQITLASGGSNDPCLVRGMVTQGT